MLFDLSGRGRRRTVPGHLPRAGPAHGHRARRVRHRRRLRRHRHLQRADATNSGASSASLHRRHRQGPQGDRRSPQNASAYGALVADLFHEVGCRLQLQPDAGPVHDGRALRRSTRCRTAWQGYLAVNPNNPDPTLAAEMVQVYDGSNNALNQPSNALQAEQIVVANQTHAGLRRLRAARAVRLRSPTTPARATSRRRGDRPRAAAPTAPSCARELKAIKANPSAATQAPSQPQATGPQTFSIPSTTPSGASTATGASSSAAKKH